MRQSDKVVQSDQPKYLNLAQEELFVLALNQGGVRELGGKRLCATTNIKARSPEGKYFIHPLTGRGAPWFGTAKPMESATFNRLLERAQEHLLRGPRFCEQVSAIEDHPLSLGINFYTESAWHSLFVQHLFFPWHAPDRRMTIYHAPSLELDPKKYGLQSPVVIAMNLTERIALIIGTDYAGEIKKAVFTQLNWDLPSENMLPMHCACNYASNNLADVSLFFGLSGTGKTTLSADPLRKLVGDDEHGWSSNGVFCFENGFYPKTKDITPKREPLIWAGIQTPHVIFENSPVDNGGDDGGIPRFVGDDCHVNSRAVCPLDAIGTHRGRSSAGHPQDVFLLTFDTSGTIPPICTLTNQQAVYYFLVGYTSKVSKTEVGIHEPQPTFSPCFGAPFLAQHPLMYAEMLQKFLHVFKPRVWLVNTGYTWSGVRDQRRMPLELTRSLIRTAQGGNFKQEIAVTVPHLGLFIPEANDKGLVAVMRPPIEDPQYEKACASLHQLFQQKYAEIAA
ncbi:MAG: hypothetical protein A2666_03415 [Parcubacteria group bacterium RIFCSPHIGHO2_01_FULL_47_10b]|nr:MAG: hypothetical protein A2666_03415 [Parcubacteria group bacterium RIFCSPHIGHO2_01_FULL_47_10b]